jgi:hypothetical protein
VFVENAGSPLALFRRALATNNVTLANTAALELGQLNLADALSLTLLYRDQAPDLFERAAIRWHSRFCREVNQRRPTATHPRRKTGLVTFARANWRYLPRSAPRTSLRR